jgi:hypothetical protein
MCESVIVDGQACVLRPNHHNEYDVVAPDGFTVGRRDCDCRNISCRKDTSCGCAPGDLGNPLVLRLDS